jgi:hypothetical protein
VVFLGLANIALALATMACLAGAMLGLIFFVPFVAGAWALTFLAILGSNPPTTARARA